MLLGRIRQSCAGSNTHRACTEFPNFYCCHSPPEKGKMRLQTLWIPTCQQNDRTALVHLPSPLPSPALSSNSIPIPPRYACFSNQPAIMRLLLRYHANPRLTTDANNADCMICCIFPGWFATVRLCKVRLSRLSRLPGRGGITCTYLAGNPIYFWVECPSFAPYRAQMPTYYPCVVQHTRVTLVPTVCLVLRRRGSCRCHVC